jgi:DNA-directed DNA polymerase III PolC
MSEKLDPFVHLHVHSTEGSLLDGFSSVPDIVAEAARLGQPAIAVTDHGSLTALYTLQKEAKAAGIIGIAGCEFYVIPSIGKLGTREPLYLGTGDLRGSRDDVSGRGAYTHITILAENNIGLQNLFRLSKIASVDGFYLKPRISLEAMAEHHEGLIVTTGCPSGEIQTEIRLGHFDKALAYASKLVDIFGKDNVYVELMDHGMIQELERKVRKDLLEIARLLNLPLVATNDLHYAKHSDAQSHEEMLAIQTGALMSEKPDYEGGKRFAFEGNGSYYVKSAAEMAKVFPEFPEALKNTLVIAERASFEVKYDASLRPAVPIPEGYDEDAWLRKESFDGLKKRLPEKFDNPEYIARLEKELTVLKKMGFSGYFLVVSDFIRWAKFRAEPPIPMGPGRGSAAGSLIAYCLDITDADPIRFDLLFERFLNIERDSPPDIDIDCSNFGRERLIEYVRNTYGEDQVAYVITYGTIGAKQAMKDIGRIYEQPFEVGNSLSKAMPPAVFGKEMKLKEVYDPENSRYPEAREFREFVEKSNLTEIVEKARKLEGRVRSHGTHAAAIIISNKSLVDYIPIMKNQKMGILQTQWDYPTAEEMGLIKMDFLGLRNLSIIEDAVKNVKRTRGIDLDIPALMQGGLDDPKTYDLLRKGDTLGVFQLDGGGLRALLQLLKPTEFEDISAILSLYRPGPMGVNAHTDFALRKNGLQEVVPIHPEFAETLKEVLAPTQGLIIYQEQVQRIAQIVAGYSLAEADILRRAMGKKKRYIIDKEFETFEPRAMALGYSKEAIKLLWDILVPFADYAFNKCLSGDTEVYVDNVQKSLTLKDIWDDKQANSGELSPSFRVAAFDQKKQMFIYDRVLDIHQNGTKKVFELVLIDGRTIKSTLDHRHLTNAGWKTLAELKEDHENEKNFLILGSLGKNAFRFNKAENVNLCRLEIQEINEVEEAQVTYDLEMSAPDHNYVANGVITHNSHTVAYGLTSYVTAYLKANFMAEYMAALLSSVADKTDKTAEYLEDCRAHGIKVNAPDVNKSFVDYAPLSGKEISFGFKAVKGVGEKVAEQIVEWRDENGGWDTVSEFLLKAPKDAANKRIVEALALGGGFDSLDRSRRAIVEGLPEALKTLTKLRKNDAKLKAAPVSLFDMFDEMSLDDKDSAAVKSNEDSIFIPQLVEYPELEKLKLERQVLGLYVSGHPLAGLDLGQMSSVKIADLIGDGDTPPVIPPLEGWPDRGAKGHRIAGIVTSLQLKRTKKGDSMAVGIFEDMGASIPFTVFPKVFAEYGEFLKLDGVYQLTGFSRARDGEEISFNVDMVRPLEFSDAGKLSVRVKVTEQQWLKGRDVFLQRLERHRMSGFGTTNIVVSIKNQEGEISEESIDFTVRTSPVLTQEIRELFGMLAIGRWRASN